MKLLLIIIFTLLLNRMFSQYDINDPRNPDCPCHKYQKIADEEYRQLLARGNQINKKENTNIQTELTKNAGEKNTQNVNEHSKAKKNKYQRGFLKSGFKKQRKHHSKRKGTVKNPFHFLKRKKTTDSCFSF